jgi:hypothetical protein
MAAIRTSAKWSRAAKQRSVTGGRTRLLRDGHRSHHRYVQRVGRYVVGSRRRIARGSTLLSLVQEIGRHVENDADVVRIIRWMVNSGAVVLTGTFAGRMVRL